VSPRSVVSSSLLANAERDLWRGKAHNAELLDLVRAVLDSKRISAYQLSRLSEILFGRASHYYIPDNFYHGLRVGTASPNIYQLFALSKISNYRFVDWLRVFGFPLDVIPCLQILLHSRRTVILDSANYDKDAWVRWFEGMTESSRPDEITPLGQIFSSVSARRVRWIEQYNKKSYVYAKVGREDNLAFPELVPGSIVRVDPDFNSIPDFAAARTSRHIFLVEHSKGLSCCRLDRSSRNRLILLANHLPYASVEFEFGREIKIWGVVDLEIRPLRNVLRPTVAKELAKHWTPARIPEQSDYVALSELTRLSRLRTGVPFREASGMTRRIVKHLGDVRYFSEAGSLSDYETLNVPPRQIHQILSICVVYGICFWDFLTAAGLVLEKMGREPIPEDLFPRALSKRSRKPTLDNELGESPTFLPFQEFQEIPLFLRGALPAITGLPALSIRDLFWVGGQRDQQHSLLKGGLLVVVNRRLKRPGPSLGLAPFGQSIYLVLMRDGSYDCVACSLNNDTLVLHPNPDLSLPPRQLVNRRDAEVIGQVVTILRKI
jgi:hypothetical protein